MTVLDNGGYNWQIPDHHQLKFLLYNDNSMLNRYMDYWILDNTIYYGEDYSYYYNDSYQNKVVDNDSVAYVVPVSVEYTNIYHE